MILWWFDRIGRDYHGAKEVTHSLLKRDVTIKTKNQSQVFECVDDNTTHDMMVGMILTMLAGMTDNERQVRFASAQAGREKKQLNNM